MTVCVKYKHQVRLFPVRFETQPPPGHQQVRSYRNWNPPLLGNLPDDFLRILPQQLDSIKVKLLPVLAHITSEVVAPTTHGNINVVAPINYRHIKKHIRETKTVVHYVSETP